MPTPDQDKIIIDGCIKGRAEAWERFIQRFSGLLMWSIKARLEKARYSFTDEDAQDIHQEVFLSLYNSNKLSGLKDTSKIAAWLSIIAGNIAINYIKRVKGRVAEKSVSLFEEISAYLTIADTLKTDDPGADEQLDENLQDEILAGSIETLNPKEKLILNLHFVYDNTIDEISQTLNLSQGTVASIIRRTREKIKQRLKEKGIL